MDKKTKSIAEEIWDTIPEENRFTINAKGLEDITDDLEALRVCAENVVGLRIVNGEKLKQIPDLSALSNLKSLDLSYCHVLQSLPDLSALKDLQCLNLFWCTSLLSLPNFSNLTSLRTIRLRECRSLTVMPELSKLTSLLSLDFTNCHSLEVLPELSGLQNLHRLSLFHCSSLASLPDLSALENLQLLDLSFCQKDFSSLDLSALTKLQILRLRGWKKIPDLSNLHKLRELDLNACKLNYPPPEISSLENLEILSLGTACLHSLPDFHKLKKLKSLDLSGCKSLKSIPNLEGLDGLNSLNLSGCNLLPDLSRFRELIELDLSFCNLVPKLPEHSKLRFLNLSRCSSLGQTDLSSLKKLRYLDLSDSNIRFLPNLLAMPALRNLKLNGNYLLKDKRLLAQTALIEYGDNDPEFVAWVLAQTRARVSGEWFFKDFSNWCTLIPLAKDPGELLRVVAEGFQKCRGPDSPDTALSGLITAALKTEVGKLTAPAWRALFGCFDPSAPDERAKLEGLLAQLPPDRLLQEALGPCLDWLGQRATPEHAWALPLAEGLLGPHAPAVLRPLAPDICLFFHRLGIEDRFRHWLHAFTDPAEPETLDPIHAALARDALARGDLSSAQAQLARIHRPELRDPLLEDLARALAATHPLEAGEALDALFSAARQAGLAQDLLAEPAFTAEAANLYRLLLHLEDDPAALAQLIETTLAHTNRPELAESVRAVFADSVAHTANPVAWLPALSRLLEEQTTPADGLSLIEEILAAPDLRKVVPEEDLRDYLATLRTDPSRTQRLLRRALIEDLAAEELISGKAKARLLESVP